MLTNTDKQFSILYVIIVLIELLTGSIETLQSVHYIAKPAIVISLIFLFVKSSKSFSIPIKRLTLLALIFSLLGDALLLFVDESEHFFTLGLVAFLTAHVMYILLFLKHRHTKNSPFGFIALLLIYASGLFYFLKDGLGVMLIPVMVYMIFILVMATTAYLRKNKVNVHSYALVFSGALCFMVSDSILALNKFYQPIPWSNISIMATYAIAQYLIIIGVLKLKSA
jgi:uncharacterized membrane protein YhhN